MKPRIDLRSKFLRHFGGATVSSACENAVRVVLGDLGENDRLAAARRRLQERGVEFRDPPASFGYEGSLQSVPSSGRQIIFVRPARRKSEISRVRFTEAHEIGHWIIRSAVIPGSMATNEQVFRGAFDAGYDSRVEEALANALAAELLVPAAAVRGASKPSIGWTVSSVKSLQVRFEASRPVVLRRIAEVHSATISVLKLLPWYGDDVMGDAAIDSVQVITGSGPRTCHGTLVDPVSIRDLRAADRVKLRVKIDGRLSCDHAEVEYFDGPIPRVFCTMFSDATKSEVLK